VSYKNRIIFNFNYVKASKVLQISVGATHNHIKKMIKYGWVEIQANGNLKIKGVNSLKTASEKKTILVAVKPTKKLQILQFRYTIIYHNLDIQKNKIILKTDLVKKARTLNLPLFKKEYQKITKLGGIDRFEKSILNRVTLSNKKIGLILSRSQSSGKIYQRDMKKQRLVESKCFYEILGKLDYKCLNEAKKQSECYYLIVDNGILKRRSSNNLSPLA
jgi:hypothetical protein